jgi:tetratricopeptide (TPR) repeat protein
MTEELITDLGKISALRVISRQSIMRYKGSKKPLPDIARELNVDAIVEGTVRRSGDRVRITANLLHAPTDRHLWAQAYERDLGDVLVLESEVARAIAREVQAKLTRREQTRLARARPVNPEAFELYLKGRYAWSKWKEGDLERALEYFERAIRVDPNYALAYSGVADAYSVQARYGLRPGTETYPKARAAALRAVQLDEGLAEAHTSLAQVLFDYDRDHEGALKEYERSIELNPNYAYAHHWYAINLVWMGRSEEAIREIEQARKLDPLSVRINANVSLVLRLDRQYDRAIVEARKALELEPNDKVALLWLGWAYFWKGMYREALAAFQKMGPIDDPRNAPFIASAYAALGNREQALKIVSRVEKQSKGRYVHPYPLVVAYLILGEKEKALAWLEKGYAVYDGSMNFIKADTVVDPLRSDPRFQDLLRRMSFLP